MTFNEAQCDPPLDDKEVIYQARDVANRYEPETSSRRESYREPKPKLVEYDLEWEAREEAPPVPWVVENSSPARK